MGEKAVKEAKMEERTCAKRRKMGEEAVKEAKKEERTCAKRRKMGEKAVKEAKMEEEPAKTANFFGGITSDTVCGSPSATRERAWDTGRRKR